MESSRIHRFVHVNNIHNCAGPDNTIQIVNNIVLSFDLSFIKFLINTREKQEMPGVKPGTSGLLDFGCPTEQ